MLPPQSAIIKRAVRARKRSDDDNGESSADESDTEEQTIRRLRREAREKREMAEALAAGTVLPTRLCSCGTRTRISYGNTVVFACSPEATLA